MNVYLGDSQQMKFVGNVRFNDNFDQNFKLSEKKIVKLNRIAQFVKLEFESPYNNPFNIFNQIGIYSIKMYGKPTTKVLKPI